MSGDGRLPSWGAVWLPDGRARFRLWAPGAETVNLVLGDDHEEMVALDDGWFELVCDSVPFATPYGFVCDRRPVRPDPAARRQFGDIHGPSILPDARAYDWRHDGWQGRPWDEAVVYELHVGTFTEEGTFRSAMERLDHIADLGASVVELMPVAQFAGNRGWGYDGVLLFAPHPAYGTSDDLKALVDAAHGRGLMVLLDVVYNHFGPEGNYLHEYAPQFFDDARHTPWGVGIDYGQRPVRDFFVENAIYWLEEFYFDGLRLDAIDHIIDSSEPTMLEEIATAVRSRIKGRRIHLTTEDSRNIASLHRRDTNGNVTLYTAEWNDDFHNAAHVIATGEGAGYYADFVANPWEHFARALAEGFSYQGQHSEHMGGPRGEPSTELPLTTFISFLQNHDQAGNRAFGERLVLLADRHVLEVLAAALMLSPHIPMLFMGEEWGESRPFLFFTDFGGRLAEAVRNGRRQEFASFPAFADPDSRERIPDPNALATFETSKIDWLRPSTPDGAQEMAFYRLLLSLRREHIVPQLEGVKAADGSVQCVEPGYCEVAWSLSDAQLAVAINLSGAERQLGLAPMGRDIFAIGLAEDAATLGSPGIVVHLDIPTA